MQIAQAKQIPIISILPPPIKKNGVDFWYIAPYRSEKTPSLKVNTTKNIWFDFGTGRGGDIIDLVCILQSCSKKEALRYLEKFQQSQQSFSFLSVSVISNVNNVQQKQQHNNIVIKKVQTVQNMVLLDYLYIRKININVARKYLKEVYYINNGKNYFGLGFKNDIGGYEIRNKYTKMNIGGKAITTIESNKKSDTVSIFEGVFDFLSAIQFFNHPPRNDVIILNSLSLLSNINIIKYDKALLFLDNDTAGQNAVYKLKKEYSNKVIKDYSGIYNGFKDFNEYLQKR